ncbi:mechanosensitive ion channel family protein [Paractinoplanes rishiriensis]|uniref:Uncharacterized protein n=1 Tax=Paractinoplanes rishiriensis TaxID=1050105 RepID=A0A919JS81_9ACTN|nr:hypothetical protein [Actinoplanes rishiriensis]GIE92755.1 hypothetical protein Ari01nite_02200 [Actinoplanes rishiriensis]
MTGNGLGEGLSDMWRSVLMFLPAALAFVAILVVGYVVARVLRKLVAKALTRAGFDRAVDRGRVGRTLRNGNVSATDLCSKIVFYGVLLFALQLAFGIWGPNPVSDLLTALISWLPRAFVAIVVIVVAAAIAGAVHDLISSALGGLPYGRVLARAASIVIITLGVIAALDQIQIATSVTQPLLIAVLATVAGVLIVGVGGGLIRPMQRRWETWLDRATQESAVIRDHARAYADERRRAEDEARAAEAAAAAAAEETRAAEAAAAAAEETRLAEEARQAEEAREAEAAAADEARAAKAREAEAAAKAADDTQIIPPRQPGPGSRTAATDRTDADRTQPVPSRAEAAPADADRTQALPSRAGDEAPTEADHTQADRTNPVPGFGRAGDDAADPEATTVISAGAADTTIVNPGPNDTVVIGSGTEDTQVIRPAEVEETKARRRK